MGNSIGTARGKRSLLRDGQEARQFDGVAIAVDVSEVWERRIALLGSTETVLTLEAEESETGRNRERSPPLTRSECLPNNRTKATTAVSSRPHILRMADASLSAYLKMIYRPKSRKGKRRKKSYETDQGQGIVDDDLQSLTGESEPHSDMYSPDGFSRWRESRGSSLSSVFSRRSERSYSGGACSESASLAGSSSNASRRSSASSSLWSNGSLTLAGGRQLTVSSDSCSSAVFASSSPNTPLSEYDDVDQMALALEQVMSEPGWDDDDADETGRGVPQERNDSGFGDEEDSASVRLFPSPISGRISRCSLRSLERINFHVSPMYVSQEAALTCFGNAVLQSCPLAGLKSEEIVCWVEQIENALIRCRWQEHGFLSVSNVVLLSSIYEVAAKTEQKRTVCELRGLVLTCLYIAYSYGGHEISYPLRPFLTTNHKGDFWNRCIKICLRSSPILLQLNSDQETYLGNLEKLLSFSSED